MTTSSLSSSPLKANYPCQRQEDKKGSPDRTGKIEAHAVSLLSDLMKYTGIVALITAIGSLLLCQEWEEDVQPQSFDVGHCLGSCYVIAEITLIVAAISYVALHVFFKLRG